MNGTTSDHPGLSGLKVPYPSSGYRSHPNVGWTFCPSKVTHSHPGIENHPRSECAKTATTPTPLFHRQCSTRTKFTRHTTIAPIAFIASNQTPLISSHLQKHLFSDKDPSHPRRTNPSHLSPIILINAQKPHAPAFRFTEALKCRAKGAQEHSLGQAKRSPRFTAHGAAPQLGRKSASHRRKPPSHEMFGSEHKTRRFRRFWTSLPKGYLRPALSIGRWALSVGRWTFCSEKTPWAATSVSIASATPPLHCFAPFTIQNNLPVPEGRP